MAALSASGWWLVLVVLCHHWCTFRRCNDARGKGGGEWEGGGDVRRAWYPDPVVDHFALNVFFD